MNNVTLAMKQYLETVVEAGGKVSEVAYDPNTVGINGGSSTPEADAIAAGWTQYYREAAANLVEVIYIK